MKKFVALFLCVAVVMACFAGCSRKSAGNATLQTDNNSQPNNATESNHTENTGAVNNDSNADNVTQSKNTDNTEVTNPDNGNQIARPWIVDAKAFYPSPFYGELAFVWAGDKKVFINRTGNVEFALDRSSVTVADDHFTYGLLYVHSFDNAHYLINTKGEKITAEAFGGTALYTKKSDYGLLKGGYIVVDRITKDNAGEICESAIFNTNMEQVQPYSTQLYNFFRNHRNEILYYNGYAYYNTSDGYQTYHIPTNTYVKYDIFPYTYANETDFVEYAEIPPNGKGLYRDGQLMLDLSRYETLESVKFVGELGLAKFHSEQNGEHLYHFSLMDRQGNLKFDPVLYGKIKNLNYVVDNYCTFNGNVILVRTGTPVEDGKKRYQIKTYDLQVNELGCMEITLTLKDANGGHFATQLGEDTVVITTPETYGVYYNEKLEPLFPVR